MKNLLMIFASIALFVGCSENGGDDVNFNSNIELTASSIVFDAKGVAVGDVKSVTVKSDSDWALVGKNAEWCTPSVKSGKNGGVVTFALEANNTEDARETTYAFVCGNRNVKFTVIQRPTVKIGTIGGQQVFDISSAEGGVTLKLQSNVQYTAEVSEDAKGWLVPISTRAAKEDWLSFSAKANDTYAARSGKIIIKAEGVDDYVVTVNQKQNDAILLDKEVYEVNPEGGDVVVKVRSNINFTVSIPSSYQSWITKVDTPYTTVNGMVENVLKFNCKAAEALRVGRIELTSTELRPITILLKQKSANPIYGIFPDANFATILVDGGYIVKTETENKYEITGDALSLEVLSVANKKIASVKGIEHFRSLVNFICRYNDITSLDLSKCEKLTTLACVYCPLEEVKLGAAKVKTVDISSLQNGWTGPSSNHCTISGSNIENVSCNNTSVDEINLVDCPSLKMVTCRGYSTNIVKKLILSKAHEGVVTISKAGNTVVEYK